MAFALGSVLISKTEIEDTVAALGQQITDDYPDGRLRLVVALKGAYLFAADLARSIDRDVSIDFLRASSYGPETESSGQVVISRDLELDLTGSHALLVEDIVDTGHTAQALIAHLTQRGAESVRVAALMSKLARRVVDVEIDYVGFEISNMFVVGYGMDLDERYRNLPDIRLLRDDDRDD